MSEPVFVIARDARGSIVHVRRRDDGECVGCIEAGLFEIVRALVLEECGGRKPGGGQRPTTATAVEATLHQANDRGNDDGG